MSRFEEEINRYSHDEKEPHRVVFASKLSSDIDIAFRRGRDMAQRLAKMPYRLLLAEDELEQAACSGARFQLRVMRSRRLMRGLKSDPLSWFADGDTIA